VTTKLSPLRRWWVPKAVAVALWVLIVAAVVFAGLAWAKPSALSVPSAPVVGEVTRWDVAGFSELFVGEFLGSGDGDEEALASFLGGVTPPSLTGAVPGEWFASSTTTTAIVDTGSDRWRVTVAVGLLRRDTESGSYVSLGVRFFEVEIVATGSGLSATGLPWITAAPTAGEQVDDDWGPVETPRSGDALADTVERFVTALLTGNGELGRYASPGSELRAATSTFETVELDRFARRHDATESWVRAWVRAESGGVSMWLTYDVAVVERDGRWEIAAMGPVPVAPEMPDVPVTSSTIPVGDTTIEGS
jgi:Conjugative transposon protein TcpC